ncbi:S8 family serine peptidase [Streptomyces sp. NBC_01239]|uniref:S8 family serine peptidase n=1 Tax=Streptomyces sp. NBC_01239 TaxID=2903792 RepID=UPI00225B542C|nr:S8 family serine peptidase [Streptomyces sp. NBC_01239]MCX4814284.1 S8 family serine peptidase [Streptomyces sp. NBC_01239]
MSAALGAFAVMSSVLAPGVAAADVQSQQWYLDVMDATGMWKVSTGTGVKVAVIDSGVNPGTSSLKGQVLADEVPKAVAYHATQDVSGHGTSMAELIAGTGAGGGLKGLAPGAKIVPYRIQTEGMKGDELLKSPDVAKAVRAAADTDVKIINMSIGSPYVYPDEEAAIKYAYSKGKLLFAAVGNDGNKKNAIDYPAAYPFVVGVSAADRSGKVGNFSEYGNYVDLAAPGLDVPTWCDATFRSYCDGQGTSMASAITSASAALIWSAHPDWTADQVLRTLTDTAGRDWPKNKPSNYLGYGLIRPRKVLEGSGINPGAAHSDPLSVENGTGITGAPSPSVAPSSQASNPTSGGQTSAAGASSDSSGDTTLWVAIGAAVAVVVAAGGAFAVARSRRGV